MVTNKNEETILSSDDKSITLTNQRLIYKTQEVNKELLLKDLVGHEFIQKKQNLFLGSGIAAGIITYIMIYSVAHPGIRSIGEAAREENSPHYSVLIGLLLTIVFIVSYFFKTKKYLKISGRFNFIEFSVSDLSKDGLNTFLNRLSIESENRKKENENKNTF